MSDEDGDGHRLPPPPICCCCWCCWASSCVGVKSKKRPDVAESTQLHVSVAVALHPGQQSVSVAKLIGVSGESTGLVPTNELSIQHSFTLPSRISFISLDA